MNKKPQALIKNGDEEKDRLFEMRMTENLRLFQHYMKELNDSLNKQSKLKQAEKRVLKKHGHLLACKFTKARRLVLDVIECQYQARQIVFVLDKIVAGHLSDKAFINALVKLQVRLGDTIKYLHQLNKALAKVTIKSVKRERKSKCERRNRRDYRVAP